MTQPKEHLNQIPNYALSIICFIAIIFLTLSPDPTAGISVQIFPGADKIVHGIMFGGQTITICIDLYRKNGYISLKSFQVIIILVSSSIFGITIEYLQYTMQYGRSFEIADIIADIIGCILFASIWKYWLQKRI